MKPLMLALPILMAALPALAETHVVEMFNRNERGPMIYEPDYMEIQPGDAIRFVPTQPSLNAATIEGMIPEGAEPIKSRINEEFTVTLTEPGVYGIKCSPHFAMGMVMLVKVGNAGPVSLPEDLPARARERFDRILADNPQ